MFLSIPCSPGAVCPIHRVCGQQLGAEGVGVEAQGEAADGEPGRRPLEEVPHRSAVSLALLLSLLKCTVGGCFLSSASKQQERKPKLQQSK